MHDGLCRNTAIQLGSSVVARAWCLGRLAATEFGMLKVPAGVGGECLQKEEKKAGRMGGRRGVLVRDVGAHRDADDVTATCPRSYLAGCRQ